MVKDMPSLMDPYVWVVAEGELDGCVFKFAKYFHGEHTIDAVKKIAKAMTGVELRGMHCTCEREGREAEHAKNKMEILKCTKVKGGAFAKIWFEDSPEELEKKRALSARGPLCLQ